MKKVVRYYLGATFVWKAEEETWHATVCGRPVYVRHTRSVYEVAIVGDDRAYFEEPTLKRAFFMILRYFVGVNYKLICHDGWRSVQVIRVRVFEWHLYHDMELLALFEKRPTSYEIAAEIEMRRINILEKGL